jgi:hypothetical protein
VTISFVLSVRLSAWNIWPPNGRIFLKFDVESTALGWLKFRCHAEVPEQVELLSLLSVYGYRLAIGYFGVVKGGGVSCPSFLGGFRSWGLTLAVWTPLREVVLIWLASRWGEIAARIFHGGYADDQGMSRR